MAAVQFQSSRLRRRETVRGIRLGGAALQVRLDHVKHASLHSKGPVQSDARDADKGGTRTHRQQWRVRISVHTGCVASPLEPHL
eukprot:7387900-Prymnesium_polylepis.1